MADAIALPRQRTRSGAVRFSLTTLLLWGLLVVVAFLVLYPLGMLFWGSVAGSPPGAPANPTLDGWREAYTNPTTAVAFVNTLGLSLLRAVVSVGLAMFFAWVLTRTDVPHRRTLQLLLIAPFAMPPLLMTISWALLASPNAGLLNQWWVGAFGTAKGPLNVYSYGGIVWVGVLNFVAIKIMLLMPAFNQMDATLEESSTMSGASRIATFRHVTAPLMMPTIMGVFILSFIRYMESFETELFLGQPANITVFTTQIYNLLHDFPVNYPPAMALSVSLLVLTFILAVFQARLLGSKRYTTVTGKAFKTQPMRLGPFRWVAFALCVGFFVVSFLVPFLALLLNSLSPASGVFRLDSLTLASYEVIFKAPRFLQMLRNTVLLGVGTATLGMILSAVVAYVIVRTEFGGRHLLDLLTWVPWTVPGIVLSVAMLWAYVSLPGPVQLYGTLWLLIVALVTTTLPLSVRLMIGVQVQIAKELEESSRIHGASWLQTFLYIMLALVRKGFLAGWVIVFVDAIRNLSVIVLLYSATSMPVAIMVFQLWNEGESRTVSALAVLMLTAILSLLALQIRLGEEPSRAAH